MKEKLNSLHNLAGKEFEILVVEILLAMHERQEQMSDVLNGILTTNKDTIAKLGTLQSQVTGILANPPEDLTQAAADSSAINLAVSNLVTATAPVVPPLT